MVQFDVLRTVTMDIAVLGDVTRCNLDRLRNLLLPRNSQTNVISINNSPALIL
jgi:hypothetical protein